jgi:hypothetical protein
MGSPPFCLIGSTMVLSSLQSLELGFLPAPRRRSWRQFFNGQALASSAVFLGIRVRCDSSRASKTRPRCEPGRCSRRSGPAPNVGKRASRSPCRRRHDRLSCMRSASALLGHPVFQVAEARRILVRLLLHEPYVVQTHLTEARPDGGGSDRNDAQRELVRVWCVDTRETCILRRGKYA